MHRQVGDLEVDEKGIAISGLMVRHLVLPNELAGTHAVAAFIAEQISTNTYLNIMDQYRPEYNACNFPQLNRRVTRQEYMQAVDSVKETGLLRLD
jgi:putative pyruvate formate lyase activating enzyme